MTKLVDNRLIDYSATHQPFPYQLEAVNFLKSLEYGAAFHEQGLGKTKIGIDLGLHWLSGKIVDSVVIVTKKSLVENWVREIKAHTKINPKVLGANRRENFYAFNTPARFYICHYEAVRSQEKGFALFCKARDIGIILDEAQKIKNPDSALFQSFAGLSSGFKRRIIMTGTPMANRPYDVWAPIYFLDGGASLGSDFNAFRQEHDFNADLEDNQTLQEEFADRLDTVFPLLADFSVRETKSGAGIDLPQKKYRSVICDFEPIQKEMYDAYLRDARQLLIQNGQVVEDEAEAILKKLLRLLQVCSNPKILDEKYTKEPGKFKYLLDIAGVNRDKKEKTIVWTAFVDNANWLTGELMDFGAVKIHGKMDMEARYKSIDAFCSNDKCWVLVATPGAAKEGLTLTASNHVVFYDRSFSLDDYLQAQDRIHRISQENTCYVHNLIIENSIDEWVDEMIAAKELAARLGLGDIEKKEYLEVADFSFFSSLGRFLEGRSEDG